MLLGFIGVPETVIIIVVALLVFGPKKLPQLGTSIGKMLRGFKKEMKTLEEENASSTPESEQSDIQEAEIDVTPTPPPSSGTSKR